MPPKTLLEKSDAIVKIYKYFEALTLIVRIQGQEDQLSLMMTLKLNESGYFNVIEKFVCMVSNIHFVKQYTIGLN